MEVVFIPSVDRMIRTWTGPDDPVHTWMIRLCPGMNYLFFNLSIPIHHILNLGYLSCVLDGENQSKLQEGSPHRLKQ